MKRACYAVMMLLVPEWAVGAIIVSQQPISGGGVTRWSQLWQDPGPNGNDLDSDAVCWDDFVLAQPAAINHLEWWGNGASELGFQIEFWKQDPGTVAYQPLSVFYYGGDHTVQPEPPGFIRIMPTTAPGPGGLTHYSVDLDTPVNLAVNDAVNPRWFVGIVGLTHQAYYTWNWAQGANTSATYQFVRGDGRVYRALGDGRALVIGTVGEPGDFDADGDVDGRDFLVWQCGDSPNPMSAVDLANWQANYGGPAPLSAVSSIPEPSTLVMLVMAALSAARMKERNHFLP